MENASSPKQGEPSSAPTPAPPMGPPPTVHAGVSASGAPYAVTPKRPPAAPSSFNRYAASESSHVPSANGAFVPSGRHVSVPRPNPSTAAAGPSVGFGPRAQSNTFSAGMQPVQDVDGADRPAAYHQGSSVPFGAHVRGQAWPAAGMRSFVHSQAPHGPLAAAVTGQSPAEPPLLGAKQQAISYGSSAVTPQQAPTGYPAHGYPYVQQRGC
jgi:hypothetical protein